LDIVFVGRWVLLALGVVTVLGAIFFRLKHPNAPQPKWMLIFGGLFAGLGVFGLEFLPKYRLWLAPVRDMVEKPSEKSYAAFFDSVSNEKIPKDLQKVGISYAVSHPVEGMEDVLENAIQKAPDNTSGEETLKWAMESFKGKQREVDHFVESKVGVASVRQFDPATRQLIYDKMQRLPDSRRRALGIDANLLQQYDKTLRPFPTRNK
jgi:hypothetical protein